MYHDLFSYIPCLWVIEPIWRHIIQHVIYLANRLLFMLYTLLFIANIVYNMKWMLNSVSQPSRLPEKLATLSWDPFDCIELEWLDQCGHWISICCWHEQALCHSRLLMKVCTCICWNQRTVLSSMCCPVPEDLLLQADLNFPLSLPVKHDYALQPLWALLDPCKTCNCSPLSLEQSTQKS